MTEESTAQETLKRLLEKTNLLELKEKIGNINYIINNIETNDFENIKTQLKLLKSITANEDAIKDINNIISSLEKMNYDAFKTKIQDLYTKLDLKIPANLKGGRRKLKRSSISRKRKHRRHSRNTKKGKKGSLKKRTYKKNMKKHTNKRRHTMMKKHRK